MMNPSPSNDPRVTQAIQIVAPAMDSRIQSHLVRREWIPRFCVGGQTFESVRDPPIAGIFRGRLFGGLGSEAFGGFPTAEARELAPARMPNLVDEADV
jgi:hypothetical protein